MAERLWQEALAQVRTLQGLMLHDCGRTADVALAQGDGLQVLQVLDRLQGPQRATAPQQEVPHLVSRAERILHHEPGRLDDLQGVNARRPDAIAREEAAAIPRATCEHEYDRLAW